MIAVITCESSWQTDVFSKGNVSYGIAQYTVDTFKENCNGDYKDPLAQLDCMAKMFSEKMEGRWDCWRMMQ